MAPSGRRKSTEVTAQGGLRPRSCVKRGSIQPHCRTGSDQARHLPHEARLILIFASIDDNEVALFKHLLHETFGDNNNPKSNPHLGTIIWKNATDNNPTNIAIEHEYIHVFCLEREGVPPIWNSPWSDLKDCLLAKEQELLAKNLSDEELSAQYTEWFRLHKPQLGPLQEYNQIDRGGIFTASRSVHNPGREGYRWDLLNPKPD